MGIQQRLDIMDFTGAVVGIMEVEITPSDKHGKEFHDADDFFVENPHQLIGTNVCFQLKIIGCRGLPTTYRVCSFIFWKGSSQFYVLQTVV